MKILLLSFTRIKEKREDNLNDFKKAFGLFDLVPEIDLFPAVDEVPEKDLFKKYDRVIFSGSELSFEGKNEPEELRALARQVAKGLEAFVFSLKESVTPSLAFCFGHQVWAYLHGSKVAQDECRGKAGTFKVQLNKKGKESPLFEGMEAEFYAGYMHQDSVCVKPQSAEILATGEACKCAALDYGNNSFTTQFHPEFSVDTLKKRKELYPKYFENQKYLQEDFKDMSEAQKVLRNFILNF